MKTLTIAILLVLSAAPAFSQTRHVIVDNLQAEKTDTIHCTGGCGTTELQFKDDGPLPLAVDRSGALQVTIVDGTGNEGPEPVDWSRPSSVIGAALDWIIEMGWAPVVLIAWLLTCLRMRGYGEIALDDVGNDSEHWDDGRDDGGKAAA